MNKFKPEKKYVYWGVTAFLVIVACIAFFWVIQRWEGVRAVIDNLNIALTPIIWGFFVAYLLNPVVKFFQRVLTQPLGNRVFTRDEKKAGRTARGSSIFLAIVLLLGIIVVLVISVIPQLYRSVESIISNLGSSIDRAVVWARTWFEDYPQIEVYFTEALGSIEELLTNWAKDTLLPQMNSIIASLSLGVLSMLKGVVNFLISLVVSVYILYSREKFVAQSKKVVYSVFSVSRGNKVLGVLRFTNKSFMDFFTGMLLDSLFVGIVTYIGCVVIGIKDALLIAVIIGITNIIPFFGPFIGAVPTALIVLMYSPIQCLIFVIFIIVLQQFDGNIVAPRILGNATGLSGFWVMFAILLGSGLLGPIGMIVGVPLFVVIYAMAERVIYRTLKKRGLPVETAEYVELDHIDLETLKVVPITDEKAGKNKFFSRKQREEDCKATDDKGEPPA